jgi:hypothetical protein
MLTRRRFAGFCVVRDLRSERVYCHGSVRAGRAGRNHARRHAKDFVANRRPDAGLYDDACGGDHRGGSARRAAHASGSRIRLCLGRRLRASHPRSGDPHPQTRRWLSNTTRYPACARQTRRRQDQSSDYLCHREGKAARVSGLSAKSVPRSELKPPHTANGLRGVAFWKAGRASQRA